jgi:hypothetical protein
MSSSSVFVARHEHASVLDSRSNQIYTFGGISCLEGICSSTLDDIYSLDTNLELWMKIDPKGEKMIPRAGHSAIKVSSSSIVYLIGGYYQSGTIIQDLNDVWSFDISDGTFSSYYYFQLSNMFSFPFCLLTNQCMYVCLQV